MATINFDVSVTLSSPNTIHFETSAYYASVGFDSMETYVTNEKTSQGGEDFSFPNLIVSGVKTLDYLSTNFPSSPAIFSDGVYYTENYFFDLLGNTYQSFNRILVTTTIDAGIAAYAPTNPTEAANLIWMNYLREQIDVAFGIANYNLCNLLIGRIQATLVSPQTITIATQLSLIDNHTFGVVAQNQNSFLTPLNAPSNYLENKVTGEYTYFEDNFLLANASGNTSIDSSSIYSESIYSDGVYFIYNFAGNNFSEGTIRLAKYYNAIVVTTTIDAEFLTFQANYDPENAEQAASYQAMLDAYAEIATLSSDIITNYAAINAQIAIIQANLALWVELDMSLVLTNKSLMTLTINTTLPNVVYNSQSLNLSNTNDDSQEYIVTTFPDNYIDLTKTFSSSTINFGTQFEDGVYKLNLSWSADNDMEFSGVTYCLVMTQVDCGIAQVVANRPNCKNVRSQLNMLMFFRDMALDAYANEDYTTCNFYINKCIIILNQSGCGCGCN
jgi:hypothetical protein